MVEEKALKCGAEVLAAPMLYAPAAGRARRLEAGLWSTNPSEKEKRLRRVGGGEEKTRHVRSRTLILIVKWIASTQCCEGVCVDWMDGACVSVWVRRVERKKKRC